MDSVTNIPAPSPSNGSPLDAILWIIIGFTLGAWSAWKALHWRLRDRYKLRLEALAAASKELVADVLARERATFENKLVVCCAGCKRFNRVNKEQLALAVCGECKGYLDGTKKEEAPNVPT